MPKPRRHLTIAVLAADAPDMERRIDSNARFGNGRAKHSFHGMFASRYIDKDGAEWRVASGSFTEADYQRARAMVAESVTLTARRAANRFLVAVDQPRALERWGLTPKPEDTR